MIDLHCHITPNVDDGPASDAQTVALARALVAAGVTTVACTSHVRPDKRWMNTLPGDAARRAHVDTLLSAHGIALTCVSGAEHYISDEVFGDLDTLEKRAVPYGNSKWLLVETPYAGPPTDLLALLYGIRRKGFKVLLAHAERFSYLCDNDELLQKLRAAGHLLQVNLGSLAGAYNRVQQKAAHKLIKRGLVAVVAGDCHRADDVEDNIVNGLQSLRRLVSQADVTRLTVTAPAAILADASSDVVFADVEPSSR